MDLISEVHEEVGNSFHLTFDNVFTFLKLGDCLTAKQIACSGNIRANRVEHCLLESVARKKSIAGPDLRESDGHRTAIPQKQDDGRGRPYGPKY